VHKLLALLREENGAKVFLERTVRKTIFAAVQEHDAQVAVQVVGEVAGFYGFFVGLKPAEVIGKFNVRKLELRFAVRMEAKFSEIIGELVNIKGTFERAVPYASQP
jgi:hypothetical protein